ncbi:NACHT domain-containing protein [Micromonospora violae]|uniref:NACHT domain-containing protein n=1 Tax=Micromonospora violae TaxID=1278207 RepID=A0A4Q7UCZ7_9ACTN|nr:NACHT domain-containing protein [Micromonospora violae]RZT77911.1 NACHT domain-containing protein [Micromonospora violae]
MRIPGRLSVSAKWTVCGVAVAVALTAFLLSLGFGRTNVRDAADSLASVASAIVGLLSLVVAIYFGVRAQTSTGTPTDRLTAAADVLRHRVRRQWEQEIATRRLEHPRPLRLRWVLTGRPAGETSSVVTDGQLLEPADRVPAAGMVRQFRALTNRQLLILGAPGSGKSTLALLFTMAALEPGEKVPVLLPLAGWRPDLQDLRGWAAEWIGDTYPELANEQKYGPGAARALVDHDRVLLVLDGLDEMPQALRAAAARELGDVATRNGLNTVVTCRAAQYEEIVAEAGRLPMAAEVTISPVTVEDAIEFLTGPEPAGSRRWEQIARVMRAAPGGWLAEALSTPLMIALARTVYGPGATDPDELTHLTSRAEAESHLLDQFLVGTYGSREKARGPERWLSTLARHLEHRLFSPTLTWWDLPRAVPSAVIVGTVTFVIGLTGAVSCALIEPFPGTAGDNAQLGAALGLGAGIVSGLGAGRSRARRDVGDPGRLRRVGRVVATTARDALAAVVLVTTVAEVIRRVESGASVNPVTMVADTINAVDLGGSVDPLTALQDAIFVAALASAFSLINTVLSTWRKALPTRPSWNLRRLPARLLSGIATGLALAIPIGALVGLIVGLDDLDSDAEMWATIMADGGPLAMWTVLAITVGIGVPIGIGRWLATPLDDQAPVSPRSVLRSDRVTCLTISLAAGISAGSGLAIVHRVDPELLAFSGHSGGTSFGPAGFGGLAVFGSVLLGAGSPWTSYTVARAWLAIWGRLPWRLMGFLDDAHQRGILRQVGPAYQFRHDLVQRHLAGQPRIRRRIRPAREAREFPDLATQSRAERAGSLRSRIGTAVACVVVPMVVGTLTVPVVRDQVTDYFQRVRSAQAHELDLVADRIEMTSPEDALRLRIAAVEIDSDPSSKNELGAVLQTPAGVPRMRPPSVFTVGHWAITRGVEQPLRAWDLTASRPAPVVLSPQPVILEAVNDRFGVFSMNDGGYTTVDFENTPLSAVPLPADIDWILRLRANWLAYQGIDGLTYVSDLRRPQSAPVKIGPTDLQLLDDAEGWIVYQRSSGGLEARPLDGSGPAQQISPDGLLPNEQLQSAGLVQYSTDGVFTVRVLRSGRDVALHSQVVDDAVLGPTWFAVAQADGSAVLYERDARQQDISLGDDVTALVELPDESLAVTHGSGLVDRWLIDERTGQPAKEEFLAGVNDVVPGESDHVVAATRPDGSVALVDLRSDPPSVHEVGVVGSDPWIAVTRDWALIADDDEAPMTTLWTIADEPREVAELPANPISSDTADFTADEVDATQSWMLLERARKDDYAVEVWHLRGTPRATELGALYNGRRASFSGRHLVYADDAAGTRVYDLPADGDTPQLRSQREYVSGITLADGGEWGLLEHGSQETSETLISVQPLEPRPPSFNRDPWQVACGLVKTPLSQERWREIAPAGAPYREICRGKLY